MKKKHTPEFISNQRMTNILNRLMAEPGKYVHLSRYSITNPHKRVLFEKVTNTLKLMGIKHQIPAGTCKIRVLTEEHLKNVGPSTWDRDRIPSSEVYG